MKPVIFFRADGNALAGYGHVIRSLSLAYLLKKKYTCVFIIQNPDTFLSVQIKKVCDKIIEIPVSKNYLAESKMLSQKVIQPNDMVVLDGYNFNSEYQYQIKKSSFKLVCIDDIYNTHFVADAVINHSEGISPGKYSKEFYTKLYLGIQYAILRKSFLKQTFPDIYTFSNQRVFINMGGTDQNNFTAKALKTCIENENISVIDIVLGSFYAHLEELKNIALDNKNIHINFYSNLSEQEICALMKKSSCAICSSSTIAYEYASVGGILFVYQTVSNQKNIYSFLIKSALAFPVKDFRKVISKFEDEKSRRNYFENRNSYFSGKSSNYLVSIFEKLETERDIKIRKASKDDVSIYFKWVNESEVRKNSLNIAPIPYEKHIVWFDSKLRNKNTLLFVIEKGNKPVGQVRFDREDSVGEIDYSIEKKYRGKGYGEIILKNAITKYHQKFPADKIVAKVKQSNIASNHVFNKLGFKTLKPSSINGIRYNQYQLFEII